MSTSYVADLTWVDGRFQSGVTVVVQDRRIEAVTTVSRPPDVRLSGRALIPGFVNAHSHAFQRALRGQGETFAGETGSFWSWREAMYALVRSMDAVRFHDVCVQAFREMVNAGITTVGEFHYFHHSSDELDFAFDDIVLQAAREAGIRIVLLSAFYATGGIGQALEEAQQRFATPDVDTYWRNLDRLAQTIDVSTQSLGVVAHSIRAVPLDTLEALQLGARDRNLPFHMHVEEQPKEIDECVTAYGKTPTRAILDTLNDDLTLVSVHSTHTAQDDMRDFLEAGGRVCICPTTEANLGDGVPDMTHLATAANAISLGTDSNARISMLEEARGLEYGQRLSRQMRGALTDPNGVVGPRLLQIATEGGAAALNIHGGRIAAGYVADLVTIDLSAPALQYADADSLATALMLGAGDDVIDAVCVGGTWTATE